MCIRDRSYWDPAASGNSENLGLIDSASQSTLSVPEVQVMSVPTDTPSSNIENLALSDTSSQSTLSLPEVQLLSIPADNSVSTTVVDESAVSVKAGSADLITLWILSACGLLAIRRRRNRA